MILKCHFATFLSPVHYLADLRLHLRFDVEGAAPHDLPHGLPEPLRDCIGEVRNEYIYKSTAVFSLLIRAQTRNTLPLTSSGFPLLIK